MNNVEKKKENIAESKKQTYKRYKSELIHVSRKKLLPIARIIKRFTLEKCYMYFYCLNKRYAKVICKWITYIIKNLEIEYDISNSEAKSRILQFIVLEKSNNRKRGLRYAAKGRTYRTDVVSTRLNAYIN